MGKLYHPPLVVMATGTAVCHREPRDGEHGLEGYNLRDTYRFTRMKAANGGYIRVYPDVADGASASYYEVCGRDVFLKFFRIVEEVADAADRRGS